MPDAFATTGNEPVRSGFVPRTVMSLAWPGAWRAAVGVGVPELLLGVLLVSAAVNGPLAIWRAWGFGTFLRDGAAAYDAAYDPIVVEDGHVRIDGTRIVDYVDPDGSTTMLVDPEETVPDAAVTTPQSLIVRRDVIVQHKAFGQVQTVPVAELQDVFGVDPLVIDGEHLNAFADGWGRVVELGVAVLVAGLGMAFDVVGALLYGAIAAAGVRLLPFASRWTFAEVLRVAVAASTALVVPGVLLHVVGVSAPCCSNLVLWPLLLALLTGLAVGWSSGPEPAGAPIG
jgi:hypothetical protein